MLNNKKVSLSDILRDFDRGLLGKTAEELEEEAAAGPDAVPPVAAAPVVAPANEPEYEDEDEYDDYDEDEDDGCECGECETCRMHEAVDDLEESQNDAIDAAKALRDMADDYIDRHDEELAKEAELFGAVFAKTACEYMSQYASQHEAYDPYEYEQARQMVKTAVDQAYRYTMRKLAEGEIADDETMSLAAQAVSDAASAARTLVENLGGGPAGEDPEAEAGRAAAEAYNETMAQMQGSQATPEEQQQAAQGGYDEAMAQMQQAAPQGEPTAMQQMPEVASNAYDQAMGQIQDQQQQPQQGY